MRDSRAGSSRPSSRSNSHERFCCAIRRRCSRLARRATTPCRLRELLVEIAAQAVELLRLAQVLGGDGLVELDGEGAIVGTARLVVAELARPLRLARRLGVAHVGVVGHVGGRRVGGLGRGVGHVLGGHLRVLHAHALHLVGVGGLAVLAGILLAAVLLALLVFLLVDRGCGRRPFRARRADRARRRRTGAGPRPGPRACRDRARRGPRSAGARDRPASWPPAAAPCRSAARAPRAPARPRSARRRGR